MHLPPAVGESPAAFGDPGYFAVLVIIIETRSHGLSFQVGIRVAAVQTQISQLRIGYLVQVRRHDSEMFRRWSIDVNENDPVLFQKVDCRF